MMLNLPARTLELTVARLCDAIIPSTLERRKWFNLSEQSLWHELVSCILGSRVRFEVAYEATNRLRRSGLLDIKAYESPELLEAAISKILLSRSSSSPENAGQYPYPRLRANHISRTVESVYGNGISLKKLLVKCSDAYLARHKLSATAVGIGPKQASLFLRNIGFTDDLAILDVHVLQYMEIVGMLSPRKMKLHSLKFYENLEETLQSYANTMSTKLSLLDTAIWIVMRVYKEVVVK